jgi:alanine racemase
VPEACEKGSLRRDGEVRAAPVVKGSCNSWIEVDTSAVRRNTAAVCALVGRDVQVMAVVKADGYGHGMAAAARAALAGGASHLGVASAAEGAELRAAGIEAPILVLGCGMPEQARDVVEHGLTQTLATEAMARALSGEAVAAGREVAVHLKVDTGMGRLGLWPQELPAFARLVSQLPGLRVEGVYSHLATADHDDTTYARGQANRFRQALAGLEAAGIKPMLRHLANSAATVRFPEMWYDMVRAGLLIYGLDPLPGELAQIDLTPALTWKSRIAALKHTPAGQPVSYSGLYVTRKATRIACVPVGYADGFPRALSNVGQVLIHGRRCPVVGAVCMDQMLVDVGDVAAKAGDEVVLIGEQMGERITANEIAAAQGTVVHEVVARLGKRVPRMHFGDDMAPRSRSA